MGCVEMWLTWRQPEDVEFPGDVWVEHQGVTVLVSVVLCPGPSGLPVPLIFLLGLLYVLSSIPMLIISMFQAGRRTVG